MIFNYLKIALRNLGKNRVFSGINLLGLGIGTAVCMLIMLFVMHERSFDNFHEKSDHTYRVWVKEYFKGDIFFNTVTPFIIGSDLRDHIPEIDEVTRYFTITSLVRNGDFTEQESVHLAEPSFLSTFDFELIQGEEAQVLASPHQVVITEEISKKYFGDKPAHGKRLTLQVAGEWTEYTVSGIIEEAPSNSSIQYGMIIPFENAKRFISPRGFETWTIVLPETYVVVDPTVDMAALQEKVQTFVDGRVTKIYEPGEYEVGFQPLEDIHLDASFPRGIVPISDRMYPNILSWIALLIILLACINFTSLAVGRSVERFKEIGVRKVSGATRRQLMGQFWMEAILTSLLAIIVGLILTWAALPTFNLLTGKSLQLALTPSNLLLFGGLGLGTGLLAGMYPSLVLSNFSPIGALKGQIARGAASGKHVVLRWLVGFQYLLSTILIICTLVMQGQMKYLQNKNLGYNKEQIVVIPYDGSGQGLQDAWTEGTAVYNRLKSSLIGSDQFKDITISSQTFGRLGWLRVGFTDENTDQFRRFAAQQIDPNYLSMMDIQLKEGRDFHEDPSSDLQAAIVNQAMADAWQMEEPIGQLLPGPFRDYQIVGVTEDFNFTSLHNPVEPLVMVKDLLPLYRAAPDRTSRDSPIPKISIKVGSEDLAQTMSLLADSWKEVAPEKPLNYAFMDESLALQYEAESRLHHILNLSTFLAILVACLGLFGIGILTIAQRRKEIGVRKVLGASVSNIVWMLNRRFSLLALTAALLAVPIAWWIMSQWLQDFAFSIKMSPLTFILSIVLAIMLAWLSVGFQSLGAARANPVNSIRDE